MMLAVTPLTLEVKSSPSMLAAWVNGPHLKDAAAADGLFTFGRVDDDRSRLNAASQQGKTASALSCLLQTLCRESESGSVTPSLPFPFFLSGSRWSCRDTPGHRQKLGRNAPATILG